MNEEERAVESRLRVSNFIFVKGILTPPSIAAEFGPHKD